MRHGEAMRLHPEDDLLLLLWSRIKGLIDLGLGQITAVARVAGCADFLKQVREGLLIAQGQANSKGELICSQVVPYEARLTTCDGGRNIAREHLLWGRSR